MFLGANNMSIWRMSVADPGFDLRGGVGGSDPLVYLICHLEQMKCSRCHYVHSILTALKLDQCYLKCDVQ